MKKYLFSLILLLVSYVGFSQKGLSYQAVILDPSKIEIPGQDISGQPFVNGDVWMKFSIFNGSTLQFEEVQKTQTDGYGLVNLMIGSVSTSSFNALVWDASQKTLQVHVSFNQGVSYTKVSDQKLNYNPYALYADTAGKLGGVLAISGGGTGATTAADARVNLSLGNVDNTSDAAKPISTATNAALALKANSTDVNASLALKANTTDMTAALAAKADTGTIKTFVVTQVAAATIADADASIKGKIKLAGDLAGTADAPTVPGLALKANSSDVTTALDLKANATDVTSALALKANANNVVTSLNLKENISNKSTNVSLDGASDTKYPSVKAIKTYVDAQVTGGLGAATISDADANTKGKIQLTGDLSGTAAAPTVPGLALKANAADLLSLASIVNSNTTSITAEVTRATAAESALANNIASNIVSITANTSDIASLNTNVAANTASITAETTRAIATELALANNVASNTASITANTNDIATLNTNVSANTASITANTAAINLKATTASPSFTGTPTAPTATAGTNTTQLATTEFVTSALSTVNASTISGTVSIANGGTGATSATTALANLTGTQTMNTILAGPSSSLVTLATFDGSSTSGFTIGGGVSVDGTVGNPGSSIKTVVGNGPTYLYKDFGQNFKNKIIEFNIRLTRGTGGIAIGANSSGGQGVGVVINTGTSNENGLRTADTWGYPPRGYDTYTFNANTWYSIKIITDNGALGGVSWYVNGTLVGSNSSVAIGDGTYFGFTTDYTGTEVYFDNLTIKENSGVTGTPTFRALVADDLPSVPLTTGVIGTLPVAKGGTGVTTSTGTGNVVLSTSPTFTGTPIAPTAIAGTNTTQIATTAFVASAVSTVNASVISGTVAVTNGGTGVTTSTGTGNVVLSTSPSFTGTPTAPTATAGTNTTQIATTAFVASAVSTVNASTISGTVSIANGGTGATTAGTALTNLTGTQAKNTIFAGPSSNIVTLATYDGSSTSGFTIGSGVTVDNTVGNPSPSIKSVGGGGQYYYKDFGQNFKNKIIEFDIRLTQGTGGIAIGAQSNGSSGVGLVINTGYSTQNGLRTADTWGYPPRGYDTYTFNANTWYSIKIITDNGTAGGVSWYVNGTLIGNSGSTSIGTGTYFGFTADYSGTVVNFDNLTIKDNSGLPATPAFRALVAEDIPTLNQNTTGNAATATSATSFTGNLSGDVSGTQSSTVVSKINGTSLAGLSTGILKNTTSTGVPTIAVAGTDYQAPLTLTTTGTGAATLSGTTLNIPTVASNVNASSISGTVAVANGGTGVTSSTGTGSVVLSTSPTLVTPNLGTPSTLVGTNITGTASGLTAGNVTTNANLTGDVTSVGNATTLAASGVVSGSYGSSTAIPTFTVDSKGRITSASTTSITAGVNTLTYTAASSYANGGTVSGTTLTLAAADASNPGLISTGAQTISGAKTFNGNLTTAAISASTISATTVTTPIYASTPQALTSGSTITWNPANGLNASVTLNQNSTLSFSTTPANGSYGTLVVTQGSGNNTLTLPTITNVTNKVWGSTSTSTIALSAGAGAVDIVNFYYDGTSCYWNVGQGYGQISSSSLANLATGVTGTLPVTNGGTGVTTLTGLVKGNGTSVMTAAVAGTDYQAPITLTTTGTGAATLSGTTLNIPTVASNVNASTISGTVAVANGGTGVTSSTGTGSVVLSTSPTLVTPILGTPASGLATNLTGLPLTTGVTGTLPIANGGTNSTATPTSGGVGYGNGTAHAYTAAGTSGQVLISNGSSAPSWGAVTATSYSGTLPIANGGTGATTATTALSNLTGTQTKNTIFAGPSSNIVTLATYDGSSLTGFTYPAGVTIDNTVGNTGSSIKATGGWNVNCYKDFGQNFRNKIIEFDIRLTSGAVGGFVIGAPSNGNGLGLRIMAGTNNNNGINTPSGWYYTQSGPNTLTFNANTWYSIKIVTDNGTAGGTKWYVDGTEVGNSGGLAIGTGTYFGIISDNGSSGTNTTYYDNITIKDNSGIGTPAFRALVAEDIPTLNQNTTGNAATATSATSFSGNLSGDVSGTQSTTVVNKINGTSLAGLSTGILKNTTSTGVPTIAVAGTDYQAPLTLTTSGTGAATLSGTTLNIPTVASSLDASTISGTVAVANGGTGASSLTGYIIGNGTSVMSASSTIPLSDVTGAAPLASPSLTGTPTAPTATSGDYSTQIATTAFVKDVIAASGVLSNTSYTYSIGQNDDLGGYVFYVTPNGKHGLVAESFDFQSPLLNAGDKLQDPNYHSTAGQNFMDWRVPTLYELTLMYAKKVQLNMDNQLTYWASTQNLTYYPNYNSKIFDSSGALYDHGITVNNWIRAVRSF